MPNIVHKDLSGDQLHEPKGIETAVADTVYVANGSGSGVWSPLNGSNVVLNKYVPQTILADLGVASTSCYLYMPFAGTIDAVAVITDSDIQTTDTILSFYINGVLQAETMTLTIIGSGAGLGTTAYFVTPFTVTSDAVLEVRTDGACTNSVKGYISAIVTAT